MLNTNKFLIAAQRFAVSDLEAGDRTAVIDFDQTGDQPHRLAFEARISRDFEYEPGDEELDRAERAALVLGGWMYCALTLALKIPGNPTMSVSMRFDGIKVRGTAEERAELWHMVLSDAAQHLCVMLGSLNGGALMVKLNEMDLRTTARELAAELDGYEPPDAATTQAPVN